MGLDWRDGLCRRLTPELAGLLRALTPEEAERVEEIRVRADRPVELAGSGGSATTNLVLGAREIDALVVSLSGYARHAVENQLAEGYLPLEGGHRAGVSGRWARGPDRESRMERIRSVCIRVAREVKGASEPIRARLLSREGRPMRVLLVGPPGCGKTTVLRDAALWLSDAAGLHVCAADEREELFPAGPPPGRGMRLDVLGGAKKADALGMLLRAMAPQVVVTDEIGRPEDADALRDAARCGVGLLATAHASSIAEARERPTLRGICRDGTFERIVLLGTHGQPVGSWERNGGEAACGMRR